MYVGINTRARNMVAHNAARAYAQIGIETGVAAASPHRMIMMLYDGAILAIADATGHLAAQRIPQKGQAISRAISIIDEGLRSSLDLRRGGKIASDLERLYDYMNRRLLLASVRNEAGGLTEVSGLLRELRDAWAEIADKADVQPALAQQVAA
jgi:flagellar protein FliS